ncbi:hypothetical protein O6H91_10G035400 [Diphasiastrum complanatum]|uniref:Uncharacterized protein n=2 Tax=Diphasiastrum complanatum TaxID=34168 RepID=A0ACC2CG03_DIPCM|nr:hypothetical protein O6H91_10G035400 [Diphasiastrum complanatum]KAJ7540902.1 hypothetical protein O6H91_10G035400 [Diphasiastrum complanatum]
MDTENQSPTFPFDVSGPGADRLRLAVKAKLTEFLEIYTDDVLAEYVVVLVGHGKQQAQATADLEAFLGDQTESFVAWLWDHLTANKQLYVADTPSVDTFECEAGGEKQSLLKPQPELELISHLAGQEVSEMQTKNSKVQSRHASSRFTNVFKDPSTSSRREKEKDSQEKDSRQDDLVHGIFKSGEIKTGHNQQKRRRSPEPWSRRARGCTDEKERSKKELVPLHVRATRRLLESAVRDAVAPAVNGPRKHEFKRLRSIVAAESDRPSSLVESVGMQHASRSRATIFKHGAKISPAVIVALKAAAAAAEDVNSYNKKNKARFLSNVWDRLGTKISECPTVQEEAVEVGDRQEVIGVDQALPNEESSEVEEGMISDGPDDSPINDRHEWTSMGKGSSGGSTPEEDACLPNDDIAPLDDDTMHFDEVGSTPSDALLGGSNVFEWQTSADMIRHGYDVDVVVDDIEAITEAPAHAIQRYEVQSYIAEETLQRAQEEATAPPYRYTSNFEQDELEDQQQKPPSSSGRLSNSQKTVPSHANLSSFKNANKQMVVAHSTAQADMDAQKETRLLRTDDIEPPEIDVSEMRKRMRQVELEMTKLRARQAEVTKEVQKVTAPPPPPPIPPPPGAKSSSQPSEEDDVDARSVFVTNVHFAATKDVISSHFANCGDVVRVTMLTDGATGMPKGSAYVEFSSKDGVEKAVKLNESNLLSRLLKVVRKEVAFPETSPVIRPALLHPLRLAVRPVVRGTFFRRPPILMRPSRVLRPFPSGQRLQWKRETSLSSPHGYPSAPYFDGPGGSFMPSVNGYRSAGGPIRHKRSLSYVRGTSGPTCDTAVNVEEQKAG